MTDAATAVTERALESFVGAYLSSLGADIQKQDRRWSITLPDGADTEIALDGEALVVATDPSDVKDGCLALAPESPFVEKLLDEAASRTPVGSLALANDDLDVQPPRWVTAGNVQVEDSSFTPYYDRNALCTLVHVGIETVSEYQSEELLAIAVDLDGHTRLPELAEAYLELAESAEATVNSASVPPRRTLKKGLDAAREAAEEEISPIVQEIRERATRAAEVELEEYREYVRQQREELKEDIDRLNERVEEATAAVENAHRQQERVTALRERKELRTERKGLQEELDELRSKIEADFPDRRRDVRDRHDLTVRIRPVALSAVTYERGELHLAIREENTTTTLTLPAGVGVGVTDEPECDQCSTSLTETNPLSLNGGRLVGKNCCQ